MNLEQSGRSSIVSVAILSYLISQVSFLHPEIGADVLVDGPGKFVVQLACNERHDDCSDEENARNRNFDGNDLDVYVFIDRLNVQYADGVGYLPRFCSAKDHQAKVAHAEANDLNRISHSQGIPNKHKKIEHPKEVDSSHHRHCPGVCDNSRRDVLQQRDILLECAKGVPATTKISYSQPHRQTDSGTHASRAKTTIA